MGIPTTFTQEIADKIYEQLIEGRSLREICSDPDMPPESTVRTWVSDDREGFAAQYARARDLNADAEFDGIVALSDESPQFTPDGRVDPGWVSWQKNRIDARKWTLARKSPKKYGDKISNEHSGPNGAPLAPPVINVTFVDPEDDDDGDS